MKKQTKIFYALTVALGISTALAGIAAADADIQVRAYTPQAVVRPQPLVAAPQPVYVKEPVAVEEQKPEIIYHSAPVEPAPRPVTGVPQPIYLTSPTPPPAANLAQKTCNKGCNKCKTGGCSQPAPMPCQTGGCPQPAPVIIQEPAPEPMPCQTGGCPQPAPVIIQELAPEPTPLYLQKPCEATGECNRVPPPDKDGSLFPGGECRNCAGGKKPVEQPIQQEQPIQPEPCVECAQPQPVVMPVIQRNCCQMAPIALDHVDFRIKEKFSDGLYSNRIGQYRFRIFGCRRMNKDARLNSGRIMEKNINFQKYFEEAVDSCYKVLPAPRDLCLQAVPTELPEYILTAEITDYFMNICDEFDWGKTEKKEQRSGNSEITITWRLMDLTKNTVYWKGETSGYGEIYDGEPDGEVKLIERAFADAASNLSAMTGFEDQLMQRVPAETISAQRYAIIEEERAINPIKCGYRKEYECASSCVITGPDSDVSKCQQTCGCTTCVEPQPTPVTTDCTKLNEEGIAVPVPCDTPVETGKVEEIPVQVTAQSCYDETGNFVESATCKVVDDTWIDTGDVRALDNLCVTTANPCSQLTPETMYRLRSSVVQIEGAHGKKGAGLLISDRYILTSGDLIDQSANSYRVKTIRNAELNARAVRINPSKDTALLMLDQSVEYTPLALKLSLPEVNRSGFLTLGLLDVNDFKDGEDYLENSAKIAGYRYTEDKGAEVLVNTFIQNVTVGGALFYKDCTVNGMAHSGIRTNDGLDVYIPTETALRSLGISICGQEYVAESPWQQTVYKPVTTQITIIPQAPEVMAPEDRK